MRTCDGSRRFSTRSWLIGLAVAGVMVGSACGSGDEDTGTEPSSTTADTTVTEESTDTETESEESTTTSVTTVPPSSETSSDPESSDTTASDTTSSDAGGDGDLVFIELMVPSEVEALIERAGCEVDPEFGRGSGMVAFFLGGFGPGGDPPVEIDRETSFLCSDGGDLSIVGLSLGDSADAAAMATWLASNDGGSCRDIGFAGTWAFLYATSDNPPDTVRLDEMMALFGGEMEVTCPAR